MIDMWNVDAYAQFIDSHTKIAKDLLFGIPNYFNPNVVYDLGCGPGNSTILLRDRWPDAKIIGLDSSVAMLKKARENYPSIEFIEEDIANFIPQEKVDCIFSNAAFQWLGNHDVLIPRCLSFLHPGGFLAIEIPNNYHCASHQITIQLLERHRQWEHLLKTLRYGYLTKPLYHSYLYYDLLSNAKHIQLWETDYYQEMLNHQEIFHWVKGTGLRPILSQMNVYEQKEFEKLYLDAISQKYNIQKNGKVLLPYKRIFIVAGM